MSHINDGALLPTIRARFAAKVFERKIEAARRDIIRVLRETMADIAKRQLTEHVREVTEEGDHIKIELGTYPKFIIAGLPFNFEGNKLIYRKYDLPMLLGSVALGAHAADKMFYDTFGSFLLWKVENGFVTIYTTI